MIPGARQGRAREKLTMTVGHRAEHAALRGRQGAPRLLESICRVDDRCGHRVTDGILGVVGLLEELVGQQHRPLRVAGADRHEGVDVLDQVVAIATLQRVGDEVAQRRQREGSHRAPGRGQQILELIEDDQTALAGALVYREGKVKDLMQRAQSASIRAPRRQGDGR